MKRLRHAPILAFAALVLFACTGTASQDPDAIGASDSDAADSVDADSVDSGVDAEALCGNGVVEAGEECDGPMVADGYTCEALNAERFGDVTCDDDCRVGVESCEVCCHCTTDDSDCVSCGSTCDDGTRPCAAGDSLCQCLTGREVREKCSRPVDWVPSDTWSYVSRIQLPADEECCFDLDEDGDIDNVLVDVLQSLFGADSIRADAVNAAIERDALTTLFEWNALPDDLGIGGTVDFSVFLGDNDIDEDGEPDQDWGTERAQGSGVFQVSLDSFGEAGSQVQFLGGGVTDGELESGPSQFFLVAPIPDLLTLDITIEDAQVAGPIRREASGVWSENNVTDVDGEDVEVGGIRLGGVIAIDQVVGLLNDMSADCETCAGLDGGGLFSGEESERTYSLECTQDVSGAGECTPDDGLLCPRLEELCGSIGTVAALLDIDTNGNNVMDALSVGLRLTLVGASLGDPPISP